MQRKAPVPCPVIWPEPQSLNEREAGTSVQHDCALPAIHLDWPSALHPGPMDHVCGCGATTPVRDVEPAPTTTHRWTGARPPRDSDQINTSGVQS